MRSGTTGAAGFPPVRSTRADRDTVRNVFESFQTEEAKR